MTNQQRGPEFLLSLSSAMTVSVSLLARAQDPTRPASDIGSVHVNIFVTASSGSNR